MRQVHGLTLETTGDEDHDRLTDKSGKQDQFHGAGLVPRRARACRLIRRAAEEFGDVMCGRD